MTTYRKTATSLIALGLSLQATGAMADLNAQQVWEDWQSYLQSFGYEVSATEEASGNTLTLNDISMTMAMPEEAGNIAMTMTGITLADNGDGTVTMTMPAAMPVTMNVDSPDAEDVDLVMDYLSDNFQMIASGTPEEITYDYTAAMLGMALKDITVDGEAVEIGKAEMLMQDVVGKSANKTGNLRMIEQTVAAGGLTYDVDFKDPESDGRVLMAGGLKDVSFTGGGSFPMGLSPEKMSEVMAAGFAFDGSFAHKGGNMTLTLEEEGGPTQINTTSNGGTVRTAMDEGKLLYDIAATGMDMQVQGGEVPFPVEASMGELAMKFLMPVSKSDEEQDFAFGLTLGDVTVSEMIWGIFDPTAQLPRDPATVSFDLTGKAKMLVDIMDPAAMEEAEMGAEVPGEVNALDLNDLVIRAAGAELTGKGGFTFDNTDLETFDGVPAPDGAVDLKLVGGNGLLDNLVAMGLLPEDQAMGARMMMGLFGVPGDGEDTLTSRIEVKPDGQVLANGQRLQ